MVYLKPILSYNRPKRGPIPLDINEFKVNTMDISSGLILLLLRFEAAKIQCYYGFILIPGGFYGR